MPINPYNPRWYLRYPLSYPHVTELVAERGVEVDASLYLTLGAGCARLRHPL
jgi:hypothetical protein